MQWTASSIITTGSPKTSGLNYPVSNSSPWFQWLYIILSCDARLCPHSLWLTAQHARKKGWKPVEELFTPLNWFFCAVSNSCLVDKDLPAGTLEEETIELVSTLKLLENIWRNQLAHLTKTMIVYGFSFSILWGLKFQNMCNVSQRTRKDFLVHCVDSFHFFFWRNWIFFSLKLIILCVLVSCPNGSHKNTKGFCDGECLLMK